MSFFSWGGSVVQFFIYIQKQPLEKVLKMSQYLQENTCVGIFSLLASGLQLYLNKTPLQGFPMNIEKFLKNTYFE